jgi:hypothetical protein
MTTNLFIPDLPCCLCEDTLSSKPRGDDQDLQAARFMHISIMNVHGSDAMMRNTSAPVSQTLLGGAAAAWPLSARARSSWQCR